MAFSSIIGQHELKKRLGTALTGSPGHAYVFAGPKGIGRTTWARSFAKALLCEQPSSDGSCDHCASCHYFDRQVHPDYRELQLDGKDKVIKVDYVRQAVCADLNIQPQLRPRKVYLIAADDLNEQGQNALLKSLEEPPEYAFFLLTAVGPDHLLPTIVSRTNLLLLKRHAPEEIEAILRQRGLSATDELAFCARYAGGLPGVALDLATSDWFSSLRQETVRFFWSLGRSTRTAVLTSGFQFFDGNRPHVPDILDILGSLVRDQLAALYAVDQRLLTNPDQASMFARLAAGLSDPGDVRGRLARAHGALLSARRGLALNASFEGMICHLLLVLRKELSYA
jgi:DNA polymerase-3 subunit delta'